MSKKAKLTADRLRQLLSYDPETGIFRWRVQPNSRVPVGAVAGCVESSGYRRIRIDGRLYLAHRLAWLYVHGECPAGEIDHINGVKDDNRIVNLRPATDAQNRWNIDRHKNNKSGFKGVARDSRRLARPWKAGITVNGRRIRLGQFRTAEEASAAYEAAAREHHGPFAREA
jgi:HNH endonuclease